MDRAGIIDVEESAEMRPGGVARARTRSRAGAKAVLALAMLAFSAGCAAPAGEAVIELRGQGRSPALMKGRFPLAAYAVGPVQSSVYMTDLPVDTLVADAPLTGQVVHVELLWTPIAGSTPMDPAATNASIRQVVFTQGEVGIYGGAGFVRIDGRLGASRISLEIIDSSMSLIEATPGFIDLLSPATLNGTIVAVESEERTLRMRRVVSQLVTNAFGETRIVRDAPSDESRPPAAVVAIAAMR